MDERMPIHQPIRACASYGKTIVRSAIGMALSLAIYACSTQAPTPPPPPPPPPVQPAPPVAATPHEVGKPKVTTASFYSPALQGHPTTSGEIYDEHALTAASRTLPIGTHAKVTNLKTGKSVVVRINDHGPFVKGRGIDLSRDAAKSIGIDHHGTAKVKVTRVAGVSHEDGKPSSDVAKVPDAPASVPTTSTEVANPAEAESSAAPPAVSPRAVEPIESVSPSN
jgi:rare lipoprotein A (peptidoglycan hydrolase)